RWPPSRSTTRPSPAGTRSSPTSSPGQAWSIPQSRRYSLTPLILAFRPDTRARRPLRQPCSVISFRQTLKPIPTRPPTPACPRSTLSTHTRCDVHKGCNLGGGGANLVPPPPAQAGAPPLHSQTPPPPPPLALAGAFVSNPRRSPLAH